MLQAFLSALLWILAGPGQERQIPSDPSSPAVGDRIGSAMTSPNYGGEGTLDVLEGGGSSRVWSFDILSNTWRSLGNAPSPIRAGGAISNLFNSCDYAFTGGGSSDFFAIGTLCGSPGILANAPAPVGTGAAPAYGAAIPPTPAPVGPGGSMAQLQRFGRIYALRGGGTSDFWVLQAGVQVETWEPLAHTPGPVNSGAALVGINYGTDDQKDVLYAFQGGRSNALWKYDVASDTWTQIGALPPSRTAGMPR